MVKQLDLGLPFTQFENEDNEWFNRILSLNGTISIQFSDDEGENWKEFI